jgi:hypothetical protein
VEWNEISRKYCDMIIRSADNDRVAVAVKAALAEIDRLAKACGSLERERDEAWNETDDLKAQLAAREPKRVTTLQEACDLFNRIEFKGSCYWEPSQKHPGEAYSAFGNRRITYPVNVANGIFRDNPPPAETAEPQTLMGKRLEDLVGRMCIEEMRAERLIRRITALEIKFERIHELTRDEEATDAEEDDSEE